MTAAAPIFIVGCPRSGTTLLQQLLSRHPDLVIAPETHFIRRFESRRAVYAPLSDPGRWDALLSDVVATPEFVEMGIAEQSFREYCEQGPHTMGAVLAGWLACYAAGQGVDRVGEKTPHHAFFVAELTTWFPAARFIGITRDPRAVVLSTRDVWWSSGSVRRDARVWRGYSRALRRSRGVIPIRYEQLAAEPDTQLARLFRALDMAPATFDGTAGDATGGSLNLVREPWKANAVRPVTEASVARWRDVLTPEEIKEVEVVAWREMRHHGYVRVTPLRSMVPGILGEELRLAARNVATRLGLGSARRNGRSGSGRAEAP